MLGGGLESRKKPRALVFVVLYVNQRQIVGQSQVDARVPVDTGAQYNNLSISGHNTMQCNAMQCNTILLRAQYNNLSIH